MSNSQELVDQAETLFAALDDLPLAERVDALNQIRVALHAHSPFRSEPVDCVLWVPADQVQGNDYNPNHVAPPEMKLLRHSIEADGYTQPVVAFPDKQEDRDYTVIDGFHRTRVGKDVRTVRERVHGYLPITLAGAGRTAIKDRMAATIRHNRARGVHGVMPLTDLVGALVRNGWTDSDIARELGMDADEVLRFKQAVGLPELFRDRDYSRAWE